MQLFHRLIVAVSASIALMGTLVPGRTVSTSPPDVPRRLSSLPDRALVETIVTKSPRSIDVTVARLPASEVVRFADATDDELAPDAEILFRSRSNYSNVTPLEHSIEIPPLPTGLYQVRLSTHKRTAIQYLDVGTVGIVVDRARENAVLMAVDLRTMRHRSDVRLLVYDENGGVKAYTPASDGLVHFDYPWMNRVNVEPPGGTLVTTASDGSIAAMPFGWTQSSDSNTYLDVDRSHYHPGERVYYRLISRRASSGDAYVWLDGPAGFRLRARAHRIGRVAADSLVLPSSALPGYYRFTGMFAPLGIFVSPALADEIDAGAMSSPSADEAVRFVISAHTSAGNPIEGERLRYAWHLTRLGAEFPIEMRFNDVSNPLTYGAVVTDRRGNGIVDIPVSSAGEPEIFVFDPRSGEIAAAARAKNVRPAAEFPVTAVARAGSAVAINATSANDADALVLYGSGFGYRSKLVEFSNGRSSFTIDPPRDEDDFRITTVQISQAGVSAETSSVSVEPKVHHLNVELSCSDSTYHSGERLRLCAYVSDWRGRSEPAELFLTVTRASAASIEDRLRRTREIYSLIYTPSAPNGDHAASWSVLGSAAVSALYPTPLPSRESFRTATISGPPSLSKWEPYGEDATSQTIAWKNHILTNRAGFANVFVPLPPSILPGYYTIEVTAVSQDGGIGNALAWVRVERARHSVAVQPK